MRQLIVNFERWKNVGEPNILIITGPQYTDFDKYIKDNELDDGYCHICHFDNVLSYFTLDKTLYRNKKDDKNVFSDTDLEFIDKVKNDETLRDIHLAENPFKNYEDLTKIYSSYYYYITDLSATDKYKYTRFILTGSDFYCITTFKVPFIYLQYNILEYIVLFYNGRKKERIENDYAPSIIDTIKHYRYMRSRYKMVKRYTNRNLRIVLLGKKVNHQSDHDILVIHNNKIKYKYPE